MRKERKGEREGGRRDVPQLNSRILVRTIKRILIMLMIFYYPQPQLKPTHDYRLLLFNFM